MATVYRKIMNWSPVSPLELKAESWSRKLYFGHNWARIRVGFIATLGYPTGGPSNNIYDCRLIQGLSTSGRWDGATRRNKNSYGICWTGSPAPNAGGALATSAGIEWQGQVSPYWWGRNEDLIGSFGASWTSSSSGGAGLRIHPEEVSPRRRVMFIIDFNRPAGTGGSATVNGYYISTSQTLQDVDESDMMDALTTFGTPVIRGTTMGVITNSGAFYITEAMGPLDTYFISWNHIAYPLYLYAAAAVVTVEDAWPGDSAQGGADQGFMFSTVGTYTPVGDREIYALPLDAPGANGEGWESSPWYASNGTAAAMGQYWLAGTSPGNAQPADTFSQYFVYTSGTIPEGYINSGTAWASDGVIINGTGAGTSAQFQLAGTSAQYPMDSFSQYFVFASGLMSDTYVNAGTGWEGAAQFDNGTGAGANAQFQLAGTSAQYPIDTFSQYFAYTSGTLPYGYVNAGTGWETAGTFYGTGVYNTSTGFSASAQFQLAGTTVPYPMEGFAQYDTWSGTIQEGWINAGTGWGGVAEIYGTNFGTFGQVGLAGTSAPYPMEGFAQYDTWSGTIQEGWINAGTGWFSAAELYGTNFGTFSQSGLAGTSAPYPMEGFGQYDTGAVTSGDTISAGTGWFSYGYIY